MAYIPPTPVTTADPTVKAILRAIGSKQRKAYIREATEVTYSGTYWDGGSRSEYTAVRLTDMSAVHGPQFNPPQFGGPQRDPVVAVPPGIVIVEHGYFCGKPSRPYINVNPADMTKMLPGGA